MVMLAPVLVAGCGTATLDTSQAEHKIETGIQQATGKPVTASCPSSVPVAKGHVSQCAITAPDGTKATVRVLQTDDSGHVSYSSPVVHTTQVEQRISSSASAKLGFAVKVTCPDLIEATKGSKFQCQATDAHGKSRTVTVTARSAQGGFHYAIG
jgi:hypothetical protein